jgi:hypothetical protein
MEHFRTRSRPARPEARRRGFTLAEMLVAAALLIVFGTLCVKTLNYGTRLWRSGHRQSYAGDVATAVFQQLEEDIGAARSPFWNTDSDAYDDRIQFVLDTDEYPPSPAPLFAERQRLRFVREIYDASLNPLVRQAGDGLDNDGDLSVDEEYYNLIDDDFDGLIDEDLAPLEGMCEVGYMMGLAPEDRYTLYRAVNAPIGITSNTLLDDGHIDAWDEIYSGDPAAPGLAVPVTENVVLHFEIRLWSQYTTTWDPETPYATWSNSYSPEECGPADEWPPPEDDPNEMRDDVFPRAVMAIVTVEPPQRLRQPGGLVLTQDVGAGDNEIYAVGNMPNYNEAWPYLLIHDEDNGDEWVRFTDYDPDTESFIVAERGVRGTKDVDHTLLDSANHARRVSIGYTHCAVFQNPRAREYWGD